MTEDFGLIIDKIDLDKNGSISYMEFITAACDHKKIATDVNIKRAFSLFDTNFDGVIDVNEFKFALPPPPKLK